jgi:copper chaperone NosL
MKYLLMLAPVVATLLLAGCENEAKAPPPPPFALTAEAIGRYCGMNILEHAGPKGQVILDAKVGEPIWFSSARDTLAFTMLPEESKDYVAIYVSDMAKAPSWDKPGTMNWVDARKAFYVIGSAVKGGMGAEETVPFSIRQVAANFALKNGGHVVTFDQVPRDYVLGDGNSPTEKEAAPAAAAADTKGQEHDQNL